LGDKQQAALLGMSVGDLGGCSHSEAQSNVQRRSKERPERQAMEFGLSQKMKMSRHEEGGKVHETVTTAGSGRGFRNDMIDRRRYPCDVL
jgi:hypothetical protein